jgi:hypothetical protein
MQKMIELINFDSKYIKKNPFVFIPMPQSLIKNFKEILFSGEIEKEYKQSMYELKNSKDGHTYYRCKNIHNCPDIIKMIQDEEPYVAITADYTKFMNGTEYTYSIPVGFHAKVKSSNELTK